MIKKIINLAQEKMGNIILFSIIFISAVLRFVNLGYSDYQGDEIKALYLPGEGQSFFQYLMDQRKGPIQFIITYLLKFINPTYNSQLLMRFLFAAAGVFAVFFFYEFVKYHFGKKAAFYSSFFFATNGFFIAFSRIVQYQSFVIMFMLGCLYFLTLAVKEPAYKIKGIYLGLIFGTLSILSHYDGVFIAPFAFYLIYKWFKEINLSKKQKITHFIIPAVISVLLLLSFYIPFVITISDATKDYWLGRIQGGIGGKTSSSRYLFTVYQPIYIIHIYTILFLLGVIFWFISLLINVKKLSSKVRRYLQGNFLAGFDVTMFFILIWFGASVIFMEKFVDIPGTHIYTYLVPMCVVLGWGLILGERVVTGLFKEKIALFINSIGIGVVFAFIFAQSYMVFVDNSTEYPWKNEKFLLWTFSKPSPVYHLSMFGFPYYRNWEGVRDFTSRFPDIKAYSTNERKSIARYFVPLEKSTDEAGFFIFINNPQSFTNDITYEKAEYWSINYDPVYTFTRNGSALVRIYIMEPGTLEEIMEKGH